MKLRKIMMAVACVLTASAVSAYDFIEDGIAYYINDDGKTVTVTFDYDYFYASGSLTILELVNHADKAYSVTAIDDNAFSGCSGFTGSLTVPNSVTTIGNEAFSNCYGFTGSLTLGNSVTSIGSEAFSGCSGFTGTLTIGNSVKTIGSSAFSYCSGFTGSLTIGNSVTTIGDYAFNGCCGFTGSLTIGNSVKTIGNSAFRYCKGFTGSLTIGNYVTSIGREAFSNCDGFTGTLTLGNSVRTIGNEAFSGCTGFSSVYSYLNPNNVSISNANVFYGVPKDNTLHVLPIFLTAYQTIYPWDQFTNIIADLKPVVGDVDGSGIVDVEDVNAAINIALKLKSTSDYPGSADLDYNGIVDVEDVNAIINIVLKLNITVPKSMCVAGNFNDYSWDTAFDMVQVYGAGNIFWRLVYIDDKGILFNQEQSTGTYIVDYDDINVMGDHADEIVNANGMIASNNPGWYLVIVTTSVIGSKVVYDIQFNNPEVWMMGPITPLGDWSELEDGCMFSIPDDQDGEFISPEFAASVPGGEGDGVRAYVKIPGYNWWKSEFMVYDGMIQYRGMGTDQNDPSCFGYRVPGKKGQRMYFNFTTGQGRIE